MDDRVITTQVKATALNEPTLRSAEINVETFEGVVQRRGFVTAQAAESKAVEVARTVGGVKSVKNDMRLKKAGTQVCDRACDNVLDHKEMKCPS